MKKGWLIVGMVVTWAAVLGQYQVNPQVNTGIYAAYNTSSVRYANRGVSTVGNSGVSGLIQDRRVPVGSSGQQYASTSISQGSVRYNGYNTAFGQSSQSADTRVGYASTGVYAANSVIGGANPGYQSGRAYSPPLQSGSVNYAGSGGGPSGAINAQVNAQVNGSVGRAY